MKNEDGRTKKKVLSGRALQHAGTIEIILVRVVQPNLRPGSPGHDEWLVARGMGELSGRSLARLPSSSQNCKLKVSE